MPFHAAPAKRCAEAAVLGAATGLRSLSPLAALAMRGRLGGPPPLRWALLAAAAGELVADKLPGTPARTAPPALAGRLACGAIAGGVVAGPVGAVAAAAAAGLSAFAGQHARGALGIASGLPDPLIAVGEDALAIGLTIGATDRLD